MKRLLLAIVVACVLISTPAQAQVEPSGVLFTVFSPVEVRPDSLEVWVRQTEQCTGMVRPAGQLTIVEGVIVANEVLRGADRVDLVAGVYLMPEQSTFGHHTILVTTSVLLTDERQSWVIKHELVHFVTQLPHPYVNVFMDRCVPVVTESEPEPEPEVCDGQDHNLFSGRCRYGQG